MLISVGGPCLASRILDCVYCFAQMAYSLKIRQQDVLPLANQAHMQILPQTDVCATAHRPMIYTNSQIGHAWLVVPLATMPIVTLANVWQFATQ